MNYPPQQSNQGPQENQGIAGQNWDTAGSVTPLPQPSGPQKPRKSSKRHTLLYALGMTGVLMIVLVSGTLGLVIDPQFFQFLTPTTVQKAVTPTLMPSPTPTPTPFDPNIGAVLPTHRVVAFYGFPTRNHPGQPMNSARPCWSICRTQGAAYQQLDPAHPVQLGIDLVASVARWLSWAGGLLQPPRGP